MNLHVVLFQPENAGNVGNIIRTCYINNVTLHLIRPYGWIGNLLYFKNPKTTNAFDSNLIRAAVECIDKVKIIEHDCFDDFVKTTSSNAYKFFFTKYGAQSVSNYFTTDKSDFTKKDCYLIFGSETFGLTRLDLSQYQFTQVYLESQNEKPYNLANSVAIATYLFLYYKK